MCRLVAASAYATVPSHQLDLENSQPRNAQEASNFLIEEAAAVELLGQDAERSSFHGIGKMSQVRRRLPLVRRHQEPVAAAVIDRVSNSDMWVVLGADRLSPPDRSLVGCTAVGLGNGPRARQRVIDDSDLVVNGVGVALFKRDPFLDHGLVVLVQGDPGGIKGAWPLHEASFDEKGVILAVAVRVLPMTDRVPAEGRLDLALLWPLAPIRVNAARVMDMLDQHVHGFRGDDDFHRLVDACLPRHSRWKAGERRGSAG